MSKLADVPAEDAEMEMAGIPADDLKSTLDNILQNKSKITVRYVIELSVEEVGYEYKFKQVHENRPANLSVLAFDKSRYVFERTTIGEKKSAPQKDESQKVKISGEMAFPKEWGKGS